MGPKALPKDKERIRRQMERFRILIAFLREGGMYENNVKLCEEVGINRSYLSTVLNGKFSPMGVAEKICKHFKLPYLTWIETGEGIGPTIQFANGARYIGFLDEQDTLEDRMNMSYKPILLPDNLHCEVVFIYRGKMYFANKYPNSNKFIDTGTKYYIELNNNQKLVKRVTEKYLRDNRILTFVEPDGSIYQFDLPIGKVKSVFKIIATLEFSH